MCHECVHVRLCITWISVENSELMEKTGFFLSPSCALNLPAILSEIKKWRGGGGKRATGRGCHCRLAPFFMFAVFECLSDSHWSRRGNTQQCVS